ncbi:MAG: hypothetical protein IR526_03740 [Bordetella sp.]|nr:MAG: hypothetical protein IR526_03740 [Bordetella sp.]
MSCQEAILELYTMMSKLCRFSLKNIILILMIIETSCLPQYNWREILLADGHVHATFPDRISTEIYPTVLYGYDLNFSKSFVEISGALFTINYAQLSPKLLQNHNVRMQLGHSMIQNLYLYLQVVPPDNFEDYGQDIEIYGNSEKDQNWLMARIWVTDTMLVEAIALGNKKNLSFDNAKKFLHSVVVKR